MYRDIVPPVSRKAEEAKLLKRYENVCGWLLMSFGVVIVVMVAFTN